jgi:hypothetical protein
MKSLWIMAVIAVAGAASPAAASDCRRELSQETLDPKGWTGLEVVNRRGEVTVSASADGKVHLSAVKVVCGREAKRDELSRETRVETRTEGGRFVIEVVYPRLGDVHIGFWDLFKGIEVPSVEVRMGIEVPATLPVTLRSRSGDLTTDGLAGPQSLTSGSGDIEVRDASGRLEVKTGSGDVEADRIAAASVQTSSGDVVIQDVRGPLEARTSSGNLTVRGARDSLALECSSGDLTVERAPRGVRAATTSGDLEVGAAAGRVRLSTASGDVELGLSGPFQLGEVGTSSGHVTIRLPADLGCVLDLESVSGTLSVDLPVQLDRVTRRSITGRIGRGTAPLAVRTSSGDIEIVGGR